MPLLVSSCGTYVHSMTSKIAAHPQQASNPRARARFLGFLEPSNSRISSFWLSLIVGTHHVGQGTISSVPSTAKWITWNRQNIRILSILLEISFKVAFQYWIRRGFNERKLWSFGLMSKWGLPCLPRVLIWTKISVENDFLPTIPTFLSNSKS